MNEKTAMVLNLTSGVISQVLTLSTAIAGGIVILAQPRLAATDTSLLKAGLVGYLVSILFGLWTLYKLAESPARDEQKYQEPELLFESDIWVPAGIQLTSFFFATLLIVMYAWTII